MKKTLKKIFRFLFPSGVNKQTVRAFHEDDLDLLFRKLDSAEKLKNSELNCLFCQSLITKESLECIISLEGKLQFCCNKIDCYFKAVENGFITT